MATTQLKSGTPKTSIRTLRDDHRKILALFQLYLAISPDSRHATVDQILGLVEEHLHKEEALLADRASQPGDQADQLIEHVVREHEEVRAMIEDLRGSETDDDQVLDEFFEVMMQTLRMHFLAEERDLFPRLRPPAG
ncbi:MAG: hemerythrin domain-containing protein [Nitrospira sp.]|uniref:Hemerythrin domain-containing protein n=1 Tax=Nitrospira defluvii TaxID=330214 RepID=A0ABN7L265_9BACT|nr:hemerythrin domain-containing protein [Nitrospira defluvii]MCS6328420.1 hemerythrin domain-containing protein [Nitrospira sp.]CAE6727127.1 Hemerythrin domain-containing protein [Nitrospira defluvii]